METSFNIDLGRLAEMLPFGMRVKAVLRLLRAGFAPYSDRLAAIFAAARADDRFRVQHNGQVCFLLHALESTFKSNLDGVHFRIADKIIDQNWIYAWQEGDPFITQLNALTEPEPESKDVLQEDGTVRKKLVYPPFDPAYAPSEARPEDLCDFIIYVPGDLYQTCLPQIERLVNQYRLISRNPQYEPINS